MNESWMMFMLYVMKLSTDVNEDVDEEDEDDLIVSSFKLNDWLLFDEERSQSSPAIEEDEDGGNEFKDACLVGLDSQSDSLEDTFELRLSLFVLEFELIGPVLLPLSK